MKRTVDEIDEPEYIELSSEEIDLLPQESLDQIDYFNDREHERFLKDWDEITNWKPTRG